MSRGSASFRGCFAIVEDPETSGHCMCFGDPHIQLYAGNRLAAAIGYHHGVAIRWDAWNHDSQLKQPDRLLDWLSAHGVDGPRREYLDRVFFRNAVDLARKLVAFRDYYNGHRTHRALTGLTPAQRAGALCPAPAAPDHYGWQQHCRGLFKLPVTA